MEASYQNMGALDAGAKSAAGVSARAGAAINAGAAGRKKVVAPPVRGRVAVGVKTGAAGRVVTPPVRGRVAVSVKTGAGSAAAGVGAAVQSGGGGGGTSSANSNAALRGDVIDFELEIGAAYRGTRTGYSTALARTFASSLLASGFQTIGFIDDSGLNLLLGGMLKGRVQISNNGFANIQDAASLIGGIADKVGYNFQRARAEFVSRQRDGNTSSPSSGTGNTILPNNTRPPEAGLLDGIPSALSAGSAGFGIGAIVVLGVVAVAVLKD